MWWFPYFMAWKYIRNTAHEQTIATMARVTFLGIMIGAFSLALVLAIMTGFEQATHKKMQGIHAQLIMDGRGKSLAYKRIMDVIEKEFPDVVAATPFDTQHAMIENAHGDISHVVGLKGIIPSYEQKATSFASMITERQSGMDDLDEMLQGNRVIIGEKLAEQLGVEPGDALTLVFPAEKQRKRKAMSLDKEEMIISALFKTGIEEFDTNLIVANLSMVQQLFPESTVSTIGLMTKPYSNEAQLVKDLKHRFRMPVYSWKDLYPALVSALILEKYASFLIVALIMLVACMTIISLLFMQITQKRGDIAILQTVGASYAQIKKTFIAMGMIIATFATICGLALAYGVGYLMRTYLQIDLPDAYFVSHVPVSLDPNIFALVGIIIVAMSLLATLYVVRTVKRINVSDVLRFEA